MRIFTLIAAIARYRLDDIALGLTRHPAARLWRRLTAPRGGPPPPVRLRRACEHLGPLFVKFGQILSTRRDILSTAFADELAKLQDRVPPEPPAAIQAALATAYGTAAPGVFSEFDPIPIGSASVAQVHRARLADTGTEVAVKLLRPRIQTRIERDLRLLNTLATLATWLARDARRLKPRQIVAEFARHLDAETRLLREAANCAQMKKNCAAAESAGAARLPAVHWRWCTDGVMVMDYLPGLPISRIDELGAAVDKGAIARAGIDLFFTQVFRHNFFHADMHPGNIHIGPDGALILLDYGIVGQLDDFDRDYLLRNFLAFFNQDYATVAKMHIDAGWVPRDINAHEFASELRAVCEPIFAQPLRHISFGRFLLKMFQTARRFRLEVQPQLLLLQKTLLNVEGMGRELDPDLNMWEVAKPILEKWARDRQSPRRALEILRRQSPDWLALLAAAPTTLRHLHTLAQNQETASLKTLEKAHRTGRRWRAAALAAILIATALLATPHLL